MAAYYNEIEPYAADWLENLIAAGHIAPGVVDRRDIRDVRPSDLAGHDQCHFFAGIGGWSAALRLAGVADGAKLWTGSCPCQPFSAAGRGAGIADERHLWPAFHWLIEQCRPGIVMGEQVASPLGLEWLDLVFSDLEGSGYAARACDLPAASVGAPHIRQRLFWLADTGRLAGYAEYGHQSREGLRWGKAETDATGTRQCVGPRVLADGPISRWSEQPLGVAGTDGWSPTEPRRLRDARLMGVPASEGRQGLADGRSDVRGSGGETAERAGGEPPGSMGAGVLADTDGRHTSAEFPLASGIPARVAKLRAIGNSIVPQAAAAFIAAALDY